MSEVVKCILDDYRKGGTSGCHELCTHRIILHGLDGRSGRVGATGLPSEYHYITPKSSPVREDKQRLYGLIDKYVDTFKRGNVKSLYLWSQSPGTGKTTTASAVMNAWIVYEYLSSIRESKQPERNTTVFLDVNAFQTTYNLHSMAGDTEGMASIRDTIERVQRAEYAVLDDVGVRSSTEAFRSYLHDIVNYRVTHGLPTVYTSNHPISEMASVYDERLRDRMEDQCVELHFEGESYRGIKNTRGK